MRIGHFLIGRTTQRKRQDREGGGENEKRVSRVCAQKGRKNTVATNEAMGMICAATPPHAWNDGSRQGLSGARITFHEHRRGR